MDNQSLRLAQTGERPTTQFVDTVMDIIARLKDNFQDPASIAIARLAYAYYQGAVDILNDLLDLLHVVPAVHSLGKFVITLLGATQRIVLSYDELIREVPALASTSLILAVGFLVYLTMMGRIKMLEEELQAQRAELREMDGWTERRFRGLEGLVQSVSYRV